MTMITLTQEEMDLILERRKAMEEEEHRKARLNHGISLMLEGFDLVTKNGGTISIVGGGYVRTGAFLTGIKETKKGIQFSHDRKEI